MKIYFLLVVALAVAVQARPQHSQAVTTENPDESSTSRHSRQVQPQPQKPTTGPVGQKPDQTTESNRNGRQVAPHSTTESSKRDTRQLQQSETTTAKPSDQHREERQVNGSPSTARPLPPNPATIKPNEKPVDGDRKSRQAHTSESPVTAKPNEPQRQGRQVSSTTPAPHRQERQVTGNPSTARPLPPNPATIKPNEKPVDGDRKSRQAHTSESPVTAKPNEPQRQGRQASSTTPAPHRQERQVTGNPSTARPLPPNPATIKPNEKPTDGDRKSRQAHTSESSVTAKPELERHSRQVSSTTPAPHRQERQVSSTPSTARPLPPNPATIKPNEKPADGNRKTRQTNSSGVTGRPDESGEQSEEAQRESRQAETSTTTPSSTSGRHERQTGAVTARPTGKPQPEESKEN